MSGFSTLGLQAFSTWVGTFFHYTWQSVILYIFGTVLFDGIHWWLHQIEDSRWSLLRKFSIFHQAHHDFLDENLQFHDDKTWSNILYHQLPEYMTHQAGTLLGLFLFDPFAVFLVMAIHTVTFLGATFSMGKDSNHIAYEKTPSPRPGWFVGPRYHAMHHLYPHQYFGSTVRWFDYLLGTGCQLKGKRVLLTGGSGALGSALIPLLKDLGAQEVRTLSFGSDWSYDNYNAFEQRFPDTDILVLAHGAKVEQAMEANCISFVEIIERFKKHAEERSVPVEVWAVGSEIESHSHWGNAELKVYKASKDAYARFARAYYRDDTILYRHIVPSAFASRMGPGFISGKTAARYMLFWIRRGFHYVPVTYTGIAFYNYLKFLFRWNLAQPHEFETLREVEEHTQEKPGSSYMSGNPSMLSTQSIRLP